LGLFSNRAGTSVDDGARKSNNWLDQWQSDKLGTGSRVKSFSRAFPSSNDVRVLLLNQPINPLDETFDLLNLLIARTVGQHVRGLLGLKLEIYATSKGHHHRRLHVILYLSFGEQIRTES